MKKKLTWILSIPVAVVVVLLTIIFLLPGYDLSAVLSDSMRPVFAAGDMVVTGRPGSPFVGQIKPGSIVTYVRQGERITHRVISIENGILVTKGDANEEPDPGPVRISQVAGVYLLRIPYVGRLSVFVHTKVGWFLLVIIPAAVLIGLIVKEIVKEALQGDQIPNSTLGKLSAGGRETGRRDNTGGEYRE